MMNLKIGMICCLIFGALLFSSFVCADSGHNSADIFVVVNGVEIGLQDAIDFGKFGVDYFGGGFYSGSFDFGHANDIFVSVNGFDKTLQEAINDGSLCSSSSPIVGSYPGDVELGHSGEEVFIDFGGLKSLQDVIDEGRFGYGVWSPSRANVCTTDTVVQMNCGRSRTLSGTKNCVICNSHASSTCYSNDVYWYNSCGSREDKRTECGSLGCSGSNCNIPIDCDGSWNLNYGSCSATACGTTGKFDKLWTTTVSAANGGAACPSPTLVNDGGNVCAAPACSGCPSLEQQVRWPSDGRGCTECNAYVWSSGPHGATSSANDVSGQCKGLANVVCNDGSWMFTSGDCQFQERD